MAVLFLLLSEMKVATITCHNVYNHGASLQAHALASYLRSLGHQVEVIDYRPRYQNGMFDYFHVPDSYRRRGLSLPYIIAKLPDRLRFRPLRKSFDGFVKRYIPLTRRRYRDINDLRRRPPEADVYIAGSDQIWNTYFPTGCDSAFYLDFGPDSVTRVAYGPSFSYPRVNPTEEEAVKNRLARFDSLSVRESSGLDVLQSLGYKGIKVCDPVFLPGRGHWDTVKSDLGRGHRYLLVHDFEYSARFRDIAERIARERGLEIWSTAHHGYASQNFPLANPADFVSLIANAGAVVSNSFHATAFSVIYERDFYVVGRSDGLNDRMTDFLDTLGLPERYLDTPDGDIPGHVDWQRVRPKVEALAESSKIYLSEAMDKKKRT